MPLTFGDVALILPTAQLLDWIERNIDPSEVHSFGSRTWPGPGLLDVAFPASARMPRDVKINRLRWPTGASRWSTFFGLADAESYAKIRDAANGDDGLSTTPLPLKMASSEADDAETVETEMILLKGVPLTQLLAEGDFSPSNLYLLTLVDARYNWGEVPAPDFGIKIPDTTPTTWKDCYDALAGALGIALDFGPTPEPEDPPPSDEPPPPPPEPEDAVDPAYLYPDVTLNAPGESAAILLDALAWNTGKKVVRKLDGTVHVMGFDRSLATRKADDDAFPLRRLRAGGDLFREVL